MTFDLLRIYCWLSCSGRRQLPYAQVTPASQKFALDLSNIPISDVMSLLVALYAIKVLCRASTLISRLHFPRNPLARCTCDYRLALFVWLAPCRDTCSTHQWRIFARSLFLHCLGSSWPFLYFSWYVSLKPKYYSSHIVPEISNPKLVVIVGSLGLASNIVGLFLFHGKCAAPTILARHPSLKHCRTWSFPSSHTIANIVFI